MVYYTDDDGVDRCSRGYSVGSCGDSSMARTFTTRREAEDVVDTLNKKFGVGFIVRRLYWVLGPYIAIDKGMYMTDYTLGEQVY